MIDLSYWMAKHKMTYDDLAAKSNLDKNTLIAIKMGRSNPRPKTIGKLAEAFGCDVRELEVVKSEVK